MRRFVSILLLPLPALLPVLLAACASPSPPRAAHQVRGSGEPTVVLASDFAMPRETWQAVADDLSPP